MKIAASGGSSRGDLRRMTGLSIFTAVIVVLSVLSNFVRFGPFPITLALAPIIVGAAVYGEAAGAILGAVFGAMTFLAGILGWDGGSFMLFMSIDPIAWSFTCFFKAIAAGYVSGLIFRLLSEKNLHLGVIAAAIACPVCNTGIFIACMLLWFRGTFEAMAGGQSAVTFLIVGVAGINFLVELAVNLILASGITEIISYGRKRK